MNNIEQMHGMTLSDAKTLLANIGYREDWTTAQLLAAIPSNIQVQRIITALRVTAAADHAKANGMAHG